MRFASKVIPALVAAVRWVAREIELRDVFLLTGLVLLGYGAGQVYRPAGFILPGLVLLWVARPIRDVPVQAVAEIVLRELMAKGR